MLKNYLKITLRNLRKQAGYTFINIAGLAVGLACCLLIMLFVYDELGYDRFHEKADRIYRVRLEALIGDQEIEGPISPAPMAEAMKRDFPEVEQSARLFSFADNLLIRYQDRRFVEDAFIFADSTVFDVFTFAFQAGDPQRALVEPNTVAISTTMARKYFGEGNPLNETLTVNDTDYRVTGVYEDLPSQSHFHPDFLASMVSLDESRNPMWISNNFHTYLVLPEAYDPALLEAKFPGVIEQYAGPQVEEILGLTVDEFYASGGRYAFFLQPLTDIHLHSQYDYEIEANGDIAFVYAFTAIALLLLLIACINFMNLATARSAGRAREVGIRKVLGSNRSQLTRQFLLESVLLSLVALVLALGVVALVLPSFGDVLGKDLALGLFDGFLLPGLLVLAVLVGLLAGSYPALFLSSFGIVNVLKGRLRTGGRQATLRSGLVVFQFTVSIALMIGTAVVFQQVRYVQNKRLGFEKEHVIIVERARALGQQREAFQQEVRQLPGVLSVAATNNVPGDSFGDSAFLPEDGGGNEMQSLRLLWVDYDAFETFGFELVAGRAFSPDFPTDSSGIILNEAAVRELGWQEDPVGRRLVAPSFEAGREPEPITVVGVVKDFHFQSLHQQIRPLGMFLGRNLQYLAVRVQPEVVPATVAALRAQWQVFAPEQPFNFFFLDENVDKLYAADQRTGRIFGTFAGLAVLIACLGLFGLAAFTAEQRTKEIGIRKVMGATVPGIVALLSRDFLKLVALAFLLAAPLAYFVMNRWLEDFAYRISFSPLLFLLAGLTAILIALTTVGYQALKASLADPVKSLRYE